VAKNKHHSCYNSSAASKPSRWQQPPRVTRIPQPMLTQVPTRCKLTRKYTWDHSNSLWFVNQTREMSEREYAQLKRMLECQNIQERLPLAGQYIFIRIPNEIEPLGTKPFYVRVHWMLTSVQSPPRKPLDHCHVSSFKSHSFDRNGHLNRTTPEHNAPDAKVLSTWRLASIRSTDSLHIEPNTRRSTMLHLTLERSWWLEEGE
jgi:hypothetical protein